MAVEQVFDNPDLVWNIMRHICSDTWKVIIIDPYRVKEFSRELGMLKSVTKVCNKSLKKTCIDLFYFYYSHKMYAELCGYPYNDTQRRKKLHLSKLSKKYAHKMYTCSSNIDDSIYILAFNLINLLRNKALAEHTKHAWIYLTTYAYRLRLAYIFNKFVYKIDKTFYHKLSLSLLRPNTLRNKFLIESQQYKRLPFVAEPIMRNQWWHNIIIGRILPMLAEREIV
tara:strand:- start:1937 stop:2611 length:675 start_codon:yes stop_codon:yes gene_type:complete